MTPRSPELGARSDADEIDTTDAENGPDANRRPDASDLGTPPSGAATEMRPPEYPRVRTGRGVRKTPHAHANAERRAGSPRSPALAKPEFRAWSPLANRSRRNPPSPTRGEGPRHKFSSRFRRTQTSRSRRRSRPRPPARRRSSATRSPAGEFRGPRGGLRLSSPIRPPSLSGSWCLLAARLP